MIKTQHKTRLIPSIEKTKKKNEYENFKNPSRKWRFNGHRTKLYEHGGAQCAPRRAHLV